jgi:hypothetical protein
MRQQVQGEVFLDEAQSRHCVKVVQQKVSCALNEDNNEDLSNACKDGKMSYCIGTQLRGYKCL